MLRISLRPFTTRWPINLQCWLPALTFAALVFVSGDKIAAQDRFDRDHPATQESGENQPDQWRLNLLIDDDWGFQAMWKVFAWQALEKLVEDHLLENDLRAPGMQLRYQVQGSEESGEEQLKEDLRNLLMGSMLPGMRPFLDFASDYHFWFERDE